MTDLSIAFLHKDDRLFKNERMITMKNIIYCKDSNTKGVIDFYITSGRDDIYLFSQKYRHSIYNYYNKGILLKNAFDYKKVHGDRAIMNVMKKLPSMINYIEKTYSIAIMNKTTYTS